MRDKYEAFVNIFLRLNGYFTVPTFIVHAADDLKRISQGFVSSHTEVDSIAIRMPYSVEMTGPKKVINFEALVGGGEDRFDCIFAEVKSGKGNKPNRVWKQGEAESAISYIVRFVGYHDGGDVDKVAQKLSTAYQYVDSRSRYRYVIFAHGPNDHYVKQGVTYITFADAIRFFVDVRGESWVRAGIGDASLHDQWDDVMRRLFDIANDHDRPVPDRIGTIEGYLRQSIA